MFLIQYLYWTNSLYNKACLYSVLTTSTKCSLFKLQGNISVNKTDIQASNLKGTYSHKIGNRPPSCTKPGERTMYTNMGNLVSKGLEGSQG